MDEMIPTPMITHDHHNDRLDRRSGVQVVGSDFQTREAAENSASKALKLKTLKKRSPKSSSFNDIRKPTDVKICDATREEVNERDKLIFEDFKEDYCKLKDKTANLPYTKRVDESYMTCVFTPNFDVYNATYHMYQYESCFFTLDVAGRAVSVTTEANCDCFTDYTLSYKDMKKAQEAYDEKGFVFSGLEFINCIAEQQCLCDVYSCVAKDTNNKVLSNETETLCEGFNNVKKRLSCKPAEGHKFNKQIRCTFVEEPLPFENKIVCPRIDSPAHTRISKRSIEDLNTPSSLMTHTNQLFLFISFVIVILLFLKGMMKKRMNRRMI